MTNEELKEIKDIALEIDKLLRFSMEMRSITRYRGGEKVNFQKLRLWSYNTKYRKESK